MRELLREATFEEFIRETGNNCSELQGLIFDKADGKKALRGIKRIEDLKRLLGNPKTEKFNEEIEDLWEEFLEICDLTIMVMGDDK